MLSGVYINRGKVVEFTPQGGVIVQLALIEGPIANGPTRMRFDANGDATYSLDIYNGVEWNGIPVAPEAGPWKLDDMPYEERREKLRKGNPTADFARAMGL